jgi:hypothetical protein
MKFALDPVRFIRCRNVTTIVDAYRLIDIMYRSEYGSRAGVPLEHQTSHTPNEERLAQAILVRFNSALSSSAPIVVTCGEHDYVFAEYVDYEGWYVPSRDELLG